MDNRRIYSSLFFKYSERFLYQGITFMIQVVLARLLNPSDYGVLSILTVFIVLSQVFVQSGLNTALVQNKDVEEEDYSSVLWVSLLIAIFVYGILFVSAPLIAKVYEMNELKDTLRVLALVLFPGAFNSIQNAIISRAMKFRSLVLATVVATVLSGGVGIIMAFKGFGVWSLVVQQLVNSVLLCAVLCFSATWKIVFRINKDRIKMLFTFGWKLLVANLIDKIYQEFQSLVIGKRYAVSSLGFFSRGRQFPQLIVDNINGSIQTVMLPVFSSEQDNRIRLKQMMRRAIVTSSCLIFPMLVGLSVISRPLVTILLTDKWLDCVPYIKIFSVAFALYPIHTANLQALNAQGRSDYYLKLEIIKKAIGIVVLIVAISFFDSPIAIALGVAVFGVIACFVNAYPNSKLLKYSYREQISDLLPCLFSALMMGCIIFPLQYIIYNDLLLIGIQVVGGILVYLMILETLELECYTYLKGQIQVVLRPKER